MQALQHGVLLAHRHESVRLDRTFQIEFLDPGVQAFAVTLGWDPQESTI